MRFVNQSSSFGGPVGGLRVTRWVRILLIANALVFLLTVAVGRDLIFEFFAFSPGRLADRPWGMVTYMFVHAGLWHLLMNLLFIFFFGPPLEERWGSDMFIKFYLVCGLGGVLLSFAFSGATIVGASAACYGIMLAFAMAWPEQPVYIWGMFPVRVKWLVAFLVALSFVSAIGPARDGVAHLAHLGGAAAGFLLVKSGWMPSYGGGWSVVGRARRQRDDRGGSGRITAAFEARKARQRAAREHAELDKVDAVLDKISAEGIDSLTADERKLLDRVSRQTKAN